MKKKKRGGLGVIFREGAVEEGQGPALMPVMDYFPVPRIERNRLYPMHEVVGVTILTVIFQWPRGARAERRSGLCGQ
jgi:hypothetical protein